MSLLRPVFGGRARASACLVSMSGDKALTIVWIVSAWNNEGIVVAVESVCSAMEPGKCPPAIIAVTPGSSVVCVSVRKWGFNVERAGRFNQDLSAEAR